MPSPRILFVTDSGAEIGGGHVMRSLTLAGALLDRGAACTFLAPPAARRLIETFAPPGVATSTVEADTVDALVDAATRVARSADAVVFDHFRLGADAHRRIAGDRPSLAIDDLADRPLAAGLVADLGPDRRPEDYAGLIPAGTRLLLGPDYALVRPAFAARREATLAERARGRPVRRVLVSLGLTDVGAITGRVVEQILRLDTRAEVDAVVGRTAPSLPWLQALDDPRLRRVVDTQDMDRLMADADIAVGAGGSTTWERCTLGLPTLLLILAPNQAPSARALERRGAAVVLDAHAAGFEADFTRQIERLLHDSDLRRGLSEAAGALCDGRGAARMAAAFLELVQGRRP